MKRLSILIAVAFIAGGCADPLEQTTTQDVTHQIQRGVTGEGHLIDNESINNPTGGSAATQGQPQPPPP
jgi:PBP1b-binding outer membrane lipoprotein LpoB